MAISTYSELQTAVAQFAHTSLTATLEDTSTFQALVKNCIVLAEERFNQYLRTRHQETALSSTTIDASYQVAIPSNTVAVKAMWLVYGSEKWGLNAQTLDFVIERQVTGDYAANYAWEGSYWRFDGIGTVAGVLYRNIPALSDSNTTNWLLTSNPSLYLYATLAEVCAHKRDTEGLQIYAARAEQRIQEMNRAAVRDSFSGPLRVRAA